MNKLIHFFTATSMIVAAPLAAQPALPHATDTPSTDTIAACTSEIAQRWASMERADQAKRTRQELIQTCAINMDVASYARAQNKMITSDHRQAATQIASQNAAVAKYQADKADWQNEVQQQGDDYAAAYAQWEEDAADCKAGDTSKCAPSK